MQQQRILIALSNTDHDRELVAYARMLAERGIGRQFNFVHVVSPTPGTPLYQDPELQANLQKLVDELFVSASSLLLISCDVLHGTRIDALLEAATRLRSDVILLGHRNHRSGQRSLGRRLAMMGPCSVWMVPEGSPCSISRILAPTDFSQHSADSVTTAAAIAKAAGVAELTVLHAYFDTSSVRYEEHQAELRANERQSMQQFLQQIDVQGIRVEPRFEEAAQPAKAILRVAAAEQHDLLVMNTRGRSSAAAILLGSVTTQVMVETRVPILVTKHFGAMLSLFQVLRENVFRYQPGQKTN